MDLSNFAVFFLKVVFDASSKVVIFGACMLTYNSWSFSTKWIVAYYYGMMLLLMLVNVVFFVIENEELCSLRNIIGKNTFQ